jgi:F-type H+-transporting ATPase subunit c
MLGKLIGSGLATISLGTAAVGVGVIFAAYINGVSRNPSLKSELFGITILGFALAESLGLFSLMFGFLLLFAI